MSLRKYAKIYRVILQNAVSYASQYRVDTWLRLLVNIVWLGTLFALIETIFANVNVLHGWEKHHVYLMTVFWVIIDEVFTMFVKHGIMQLPDTIVEGGLDGYLMKPANTLFLVSTRVFLMRAFYRLVVQLGIFVYIIWQYDFTVSPLHTISAVVLMFTATVLVYSIQLILNTFAFWLERISNINDVWDVARELGRYPIEFLPKTLRIIFLTALPIALTGYLPVAMLSGRASWQLLALAIITTATFFVVAVCFWRFALKRYSSASS